MGLEQDIIQNEYKALHDSLIVEQIKLQIIDSINQIRYIHGGYNDRPFHKIGDVERAKIIDYHTEATSVFDYVNESEEFDEEKLLKDVEYMQDIYIYSQNEIDNITNILISDKLGGNNVK